jgi:fructuronate reductase
MDGSQKLPQRMLGTLRDAFNDGRDTPLLCLAIAAWMYYTGGVDEAGQAIDVRDPLLGELHARTSGVEGPTATVAALLDMHTVFPADLAQQLKTPLTAAAKDVWTYGVRAAIERANTLNPHKSERL